MFKTAAIFKKYTSTEDKGVRIYFDTNELDDDQGSELLKLHKGAAGWLIFSKNAGDEQYIPSDGAKVDGALSLSQVYRNKVYRMFCDLREAGKANTTDFEIFYKSFMEKRIKEIDAYIKENLEV